MRTALTTAALALALATCAAHAQQAKNVIMLVADGGGYNTWKATGFYEGTFGQQIVDGPTWTRRAVSNHPLRFGTSPVAGAAGLAQDPTTVYDPAKAYDVTPLSTSQGGYADHFAGYKYHKNTYPDSANTIAAIMTGQKTYNNAVNVDGNGNPLQTFPQRMKALGKSVGIVSTVQWADATPSVSAGVRNITRANRNDVADQMLGLSPAAASAFGPADVDLIMGGGNPDYNNNGTLRATPDHSWIRQSTWNDLKDGDNSGVSANWQLIQDKAQFEALANGTLAIQPGKQIVGTFQAFDAHQSYRGPTNGPNTLVAGGFPPGNATGDANGNVGDPALPGSSPKLTNTPDLPTMLRGALNVMDDDGEGFFLMAEAGGVDRAMHANALGRMIEDHSEFVDTVEALDAYLGANGGAGTNGNSYANTLVVVTADHDHLLFGANSDTVPFEALQDNGAGVLPGHKWQFSSHGNFTIPLYAKGPGSELFVGLADQNDSYTAMVNGQMVTFGNGAYLDQTEIFTAFNAVVPEPAALGAVAAVGTLALARRRRA